MNIAVSHPGKIGDLLFALPTVQYLSTLHGCSIDVYTSSHCRFALDIVACQPYVRSAAVLENYVMEHFNCGAQPWQMPVPQDRGYDAIYHLGFRGFPDRHCVEYSATQIGLPPPDPDKFTLVTKEATHGNSVRPRGPYVLITTLSPTSGGSLTWSWSNAKISEFVKTSPYPVYGVGLADELRQYDCVGHFTELAGLSVLEVADVMQGATAVITFSTGLGVLASGVLKGRGVPLVCLFDGDTPWEVFPLPGGLTCSPDQDLAEIAFRRRNVEQLEAAVAALERDRRAARRDFDERSKIIELQKVLQKVELQRTLAAVEQQRTELQQTLAGILASRSWRWTASLRTLFKMAVGR